MLLGWRGHRSALGKKLLDLAAERFHAGGGHGRVVEGVDRPDLIAQCGVHLVDAALNRDRSEMRTDEKVNAMALQRQAQRAQVLLARQILPPGQPDRAAFSDGSAQRLNHRINC